MVRCRAPAVAAPEAAVRRALLETAEAAAGECASSIVEVSGLLSPDSASRRRCGRASSAADAASFDASEFEELLEG